MMSCARTPRLGFTLIESIVSVVIVGVMFVASVAVLSSARAGQRITADRCQGMLLSETLMNEILARAYIDPEEPSGTRGRETGESATDRTTWDDIDDYHGHASAPPADESGAVLAGLADWGREVTVEYLNAADLTTVAASNTGVKRITVQVTREGRDVARLIALRTGTSDRFVTTIEKQPMVVVE